MSGVKHLRLRTPEQRINSLESQLARQRRREIDLDQAIKNSEHQLQRQLQQQAQEQRQRAMQHQRAVDALKSDLKASEQKHQKALNNMQTAMQQQAVKHTKDLKDLKGWTKGKLASQRSEYLQIAQEQQQAIQSIQKDVGTLLNRDASRQNIVGLRIKDLEILINDLNNNLPHERFAPGELNEIIQDLNNAKDDLALMPESANSTIRSAYDKLVKLRQKVIQKKHEHDIIVNQTKEAIDILLGQLSNKDVEVDSTLRNIDHWTDGEYSKLEAELTGMKERLEENKDSISTKEVQNMYTEIGIKEEQQQALLKKGIHRVLASRERYQMAVNIAKALGGEYPIVENNGFEEDDRRNSYVVHVKGSENEGATEVVAIIRPQEDEGITTNTLLLNSSDHFKSTGLTMNRIKHLRNKLKEAGYDVGTPECAQENYLEQLTGSNVKEMMQNGLPETIKNLKA